MKSKRHNIDDVGFSTINYIPDKCAFCDNKPAAILEVKRLFFNRSYWICDEHRHKWAKGELTV